MSLKDLLGEELFSQVSEKLGDKKIDIVNDGQWFPKERFDAVNNEKKDLKAQLDERDQQLSTLQKQAKGNEELQAAIESLQEENQKTAAEYQQKLDQQTFDFAIESALRDAKSKNIKAVKANLNLDGLKLADGKVLGLEEQLTALKESDSYLFEEEQKSAPSLAGRQPHVTPGNPLQQSSNPFKKESLNLTEQGKLFREDPELARKLQAEARG
ncbi:phage scaffolding protein [Bacillus atrophaeus]|uniref:phage scaffolding protein n=1 Tax=Bacillus atrophaeus TaxID=1452 RepID=UPI002E2491AA|nr:phage scaffolding protein [Bacillus atrophaeus]